MKRLIPALMIMAIIIPLGCVTSSNRKPRPFLCSISPTNISIAASSIITQLKTGCGFVNNGLPEARELPPEFPEQIIIGENGAKFDLTPPQEGQYETVIVTPLIPSDGFTYAVYIDHTQKLYWIRESGGLTGESKLWGPGSLIEKKD